LPEWYAWSFVKFFEKKLGKEALWRLVQHEADKRATIRCVMGYFDGDELGMVDGVAQRVIVAPRAEHGFGLILCLRQKVMIERRRRCRRTRRTRLAGAGWLHVSLHSGYLLSS